MFDFFKPKILLDTHILIWYMGLGKKLPKEFETKINNSSCYVSEVSFWEIAIKVRIKKLNINEDIKSFILKQPFHVLPVKTEYLQMLQNFICQPKHNDPFDHLILMTAFVEQIPLMSFDIEMNKYF